MKLKFSKQFDKSYWKLPIKVQDKFNERLIEFEYDKFSKHLNNHSLKWIYLWKKSINITGDYRAIFKEYPNWTYEFVEFINIWTHSQLYK